MTEDFTIIDTPSALKRLAAVLENESVFACDLEADSMYHFKEKVCLLQIATPHLNVVIDPLAVRDMAPLKPVFLNPKIKKVLHGADYDIRSLFRDFQIEINNLFDTELASRFLGLRATGLDAVLKNFFNVKLDKKFQKRDWSKRPLPESMLRYAARDAVYLVELSKILIRQLAGKQRLAWVTEECEILSRVRSVSNHNQPLYMKFKGAGRLSRTNLAILEALLEFRQFVARKKDRPLFKILSNEALMKIVMARPANLEELNKAGALSLKQKNMFGNKIIRIIHAAMHIPPKELPVYPKKRPPVVDHAVPDRIKAIKDWRDILAKELKLNPSLLFSKSMLTAIAAVKPARMEQFDQIAEMRQWQKKEFGEQILSLLKKIP